MLLTDCRHLGGGAAFSDPVKGVGGGGGGEAMMVCEVMNHRHKIGDVPTIYLNTEVHTPSQE